VSPSGAPNPFAGFSFQKASSSSDSELPTNSAPLPKAEVAAVPATAAVPSQAAGDAVKDAGNPSQGLNCVEPEKFSFATGLPFNSNKNTGPRVGTTTGSESVSGNEISTSSESASLPPSLEPDSTYEARSDNGPCDSEKGNESNDVISDKSSTNEAGVAEAQDSIQEEPDSTET